MPMELFRKREPIDLDSKAPIDKVSFILKCVANSTDYKDAGSIISVYGSVDAPTTGKEVEKYVNNAIDCVYRRILRGESHIYGGIEDKEIKDKLYSPIKTIFEKLKDKLIIPSDKCERGHAKLHPLLMDLYGLSQNSIFDISSPRCPATMRLVVDSKKTAKRLPSKELYLSLNNEDAKLLFNLKSLPDELRKDYKLEPVAKEEIEKENYQFSSKKILLPKRIVTRRKTTKKKKKTSKTRK